MKPLLSELFLPCSGDAFTHSGKSLSVDDNYRCSKGLRSILARTKTRPTSAPTAAQLTLFHASGCAAPMATHSAAACSITRRHASPAHAGRPRHHDRFLGPLLARLRCCGSGVGPQGAPSARIWGASGPYLGGSCPLSGGSDVTKVATTVHPLRCQRALVIAQAARRGACGAPPSGDWSPVVGALQRRWSCEEPTAMALLKLNGAILEFAAPIPPLCLEALRSRSQGAQATVDPCHLVG
jgi:hypothetical protein